MQMRLTPFSRNAALPPKPNLDPGFDVCACSFGHYPWDDWERHALACGLSPELAGQGRLLIREAYNHGWESWLQSLCGWGDDGAGVAGFRVAPAEAGALVHLAADGNRRLAR